MDWYGYVGAGMLIIVFIAIFIAIYFQVGLIVAVNIFAMATIASIWIIVAAWLLACSINP